MTRDTINLILSALLASGQSGLGIDGHVYAALMDRISLDEFNTGKALALQVGLIKSTGANTFTNTDKGKAIFDSLIAEIKTDPS